MLDLYLSKNSAIAECDFSVRAYNALMRAGVDTVGKLCDLSVRELMDVRNMGKRAVSEVLAWLSQSVVFVDPEVDGLMGQLGVFKISVLSDVRNE